MRLLIVLIVLVVLAAAALSLLPLSPLKPVVERRLSALLGRQVTVDAVRLNLFGSPSLTISGLTVLEDPAFDQGVFLKAEQARANLDFMQSLRGQQVVIGAISLKSPQVKLFKDARGVWSWATLGSQAYNLPTEAPQIASVIVKPSFLMLSLMIAGNPEVPEIRGIKIENGSVRLIDRAAPHREALYKNVGLNATLLRQGSEKRTRVTGELIVRSEHDGEAEQLSSEMPFEMLVDRSSETGLLVSGSAGPGRLEASNINIGSIEINGEIEASKTAPMTGNGRVTATEIFLPTFNLGERVAGAFRLKEIGDMSPGTRIAGIESDLQIASGTVTTNNLRIQQLDGLGDATAKRGDFKIEAALTVNYATTILLSDNATKQVKAASPLLGILATILEANNRLSVPLNINGDIRNPHVQIDINRIF